MVVGKLSDIPCTTMVAIALLVMIYRSLPTAPLYSYPLKGKLSPPQKQTKKPHCHCPVMHSWLYTSDWFSEVHKIGSFSYT